MAELRNGGFVGHRLPTEVDVRETARGNRFIQGFLGPRVGEIEPLLEEVNPEHALKTYGRPAVLALGIMGRDHRAQIRPGHHLLHVGEELLATGGFAVDFEGSGGQCGLAHGSHSAVVLAISYHNGLCILTKSELPLGA